MTLKRIVLFCVQIKHSTHTGEVASGPGHGFWTSSSKFEPGLRVGGPGTPPIWRTRKEFCTVRNSAR